MENRSLVTIAEHSKEKIMYLLEMAREFEKKPNRRLLAEKVVATLFFEPSTRTRLSFETAANRLGARVIGFTDPKVTSSSKGETLKDTIMMVSFSVSPLEELVTFGSVNPMTLAPRRLAAVSKLRRVRVDGSKNRVATTFSASRRRLGFFSNSLAISRRYMIFSLECSAIVTKLLFSMLAVFDYFYNTGVQR